MKKKTKKQYDPPLDKGIKEYVEILVENGIETYESCKGGKGHTYPEPTICFYGQIQEGFRALAIALENGLPVKEIRQFWSIEDKQPIGPDWAIVFWENDNS